MGWFDNEDDEGDDDSNKKYVSGSPGEYVDLSEGNIEKKHLTQTGGKVTHWLSGPPVMRYFQDDERPEYLFTSMNNGLKFESNNRTKKLVQNNPSGNKGAYFLVITNKRILYLAGSKDSDEVYYILHESIKSSSSENKSLGANKIIFKDYNGKRYIFAASKASNDEISQAEKYLRDKMGGESAEKKTLSDLSDKNNQNVKELFKYVEENDSPVNLPDTGSKAEENDLRSAATVNDDVQQWEYFTYRFDSSENFDAVDAGLSDAILSTSTKVPLPPDEVLNKLGKEGWMLVETVEKPGRETGSVDAAGSMTYAYVFRRPVNYSEETDEESNKNEST